MNAKLYVSNLPFDATQEDIRKHFSIVGEVISVKIITDRTTNKSRGFGFVEMYNDEQAKLAIERLNDLRLNGRRLTITEAKNKDASESTQSNRKVLID